MAIGIIIGSLFAIAGLGFLFSQTVKAEPITPTVAVPIDQVPIEDIDQVEIIIPGNSDQLITVIGL